MGQLKSLVHAGSTVTELESRVWLYWHFCCCHKGALSLWCQLPFNYGSGETTRKFLSDGRKRVNKISCFFFLSESILECYKSLRECLGTYAPSSMKLCDGERMPLRMERKRQTMPLAVEHQHRRRMNATWKKWNPSLNARAVFHARQLLKKSESLQQVFTVSSPTAPGHEKFVHTCAQPWPNSQACFSCHHPSAALEKLSQCIPR
jgi:hypothetical protein